VQAEDLPAGAAVVASVVDGSPAAEAGFQSGDIIVAVGGEELTNYLQVGQKISRLKPGEEITITVDRDGERVELTPTLVERDDEATASNNRRGNEDDGSSRREMMEELGFTYQEITPSIARQLELDDTDGVVIANVNPASDAYREAGLRRGMVVERVDGQEVTSVADFEDAYASVEAGEAFRMRLRLPDGSVVVTALRKPTSGS
jgi:serine protease Do